MSKKVFLSYSHQDRGLADVVAAEFREAGAKIFRDITDLGPGDNWLVRLADGIRSTETFISLWSPHYFRSSMCRWELLFALRLDPDASNGRIIPLYVADCSIPDYVQHLQYADCRRPGTTKQAVSEVVARATRLTNDPLPALNPSHLASVNKDFAVVIGEIDPKARSLSRQLSMATRALEHLAVQVRGYTSLSVPVALQIEFDDKQREVDELRESLLALVP